MKPRKNRRKKGSPVKKLIVLTAVLLGAAVPSEEPENGSLNLVKPISRGTWHIMGKQQPSEADSPKGSVKFASVHPVGAPAGFNRLIVGCPVKNLPAGKYLFSVRFRFSREFAGKVSLFTLSGKKYAFGKDIPLTDYRPGQWKTGMNLIVLPEDKGEIKFYFQAVGRVAPFTVELDSFRLVRQEED